jgi:hypothetical protein
MFREGQLVICVDDKFPPGAVEWYDRTPMQGEVYTVRKVFSEGENVSTGESGWSVLLCEIINPAAGSGQEIGFAVRRFKPYP